MARARLAEVGKLIDQVASGISTGRELQQAFHPVPNRVEPPAESDQAPNSSRSSARRPEAQTALP